MGMIHGISSLLGNLVDLHSTQIFNNTPPFAEGVVFLAIDRTKPPKLPYFEKPQESWLTRADWAISILFTFLGARLPLTKSFERGLIELH